MRLYCAFGLKVCGFILSTDTNKGGMTPDVSPYKYGYGKFESVYCRVPSPNWLPARMGLSFTKSISRNFSL